LHWESCTRLHFSLSAMKSANQVCYTWDMHFRCGEYNFA
jgi:hypothetical protein